jgi:replication factor C small subunit
MVKNDHMVWVEKYRPKILSDIVGHPSIVGRLQSYVQNKNLPHLLFTGSAGIGKTTAAVALAHEFFGDSWEANFREMNASDDRGIDAVRNGIKQFAHTTPMGGANFKILFLDEADALTHDAQAALRRTMESHSDSCRFILSCNYSSKIIDPIQSRCAIYRFKPLDGESVKKETGRIASLEGITISSEALDAIVYVAQGDMRRAINALQGATSVGNSITEKEVYAISSLADPKEIKLLLSLSMDGDFDKSEKMLSWLLNNRGVSPNELLNQCYRTILADVNIERSVKVRMIDAIGETDFRLSEGANTIIQMESMIAHFVLLSAVKK